MRLNYQEAALRVCVNTTDDGAFCGKIVGRRIKSEILFADLNDFVIQVDRLLDMQQFPQAFQQMRSFSDKQSPEVPGIQTKDELTPQDEVLSAFGDRMTFSFIIFSRQSSTWQGAIDWLDGTEKQRFNSTLELLKFVDNRIKQL